MFRPHGRAERSDGPADPQISLARCESPLVAPHDFPPQVARRGSLPAALHGTERARVRVALRHQLHHGAAAQKREPKSPETKPEVRREVQQ
jgi:hypothetical protein